MLTPLRTTLQELTNERIGASFWSRSLKSVIIDWSSHCGLPTGNATYQNLHRRPPNLRHVIMSDRVCVSVIPFDGDSAPNRSDNCALIGGTRFPANAVAYLEKSGLVAGHFFTANNSTRFISLWPEKLW